VPPQDGVQTVAFHPVEGRRVISSFTAAEMRSMMQKVVLEGTARRAGLDGYTAGGKTGTGQKIDPTTGAYYKTKFNATFAGFAPLNNPQVVVAVILDSPVGPHQGGQVSAPVFRRVAQQVLEYLHVPHDLSLAPQHQLLLAQAKLKDKDLEDETPDHPGQPLETEEVNTVTADAAKPDAARAVPPPNPAPETNVVQAAIREPIQAAPASQLSQPVATNQPAIKPESANQTQLPASGTVVLDVEQGGIEVPLFVGKTVRSAVEAAQDAGLELDAVGSGVARQQSPPAGTHVAAGARVTVQFGR
jgi:cell division protein FtsI (penicillin-binding protein 3)